MIIDDLDSIISKLPGIIGSAGALLWWKGTWMKKVGLFILGSFASYYGTQDFAQFTGLTEGLAGFILGLGSMAFVDWVMNSFRPLLTQFAEDKLKIKKNED